MINKRYRMKALIFILLSIPLIAYADNTFLIKGKVVGKNSGVVRLGQIGSSSFDSKSCKVINGEFHFESWLGLTEEFFVAYAEKEGARETNYFQFFIEPGSENFIELNPENVDESTFRGAETGNEFHRLHRMVREKYGSRLDRLSQAYLDARNENDTASASKLSMEMTSINNEIRDWQMDYVWKNPASYISANWLHRYQFKLEIDTVRKYFNHLSPMLEESKYYNKLLNYLMVQKGRPFIDFKLTDQKGNLFQLSSFAEDRVILIDFWASWCKPCREHSVKLKALYEKYQDNGFEVLGISLDRDKASFLKAISEDQMTWLNLLDRTDQFSVHDLYENNAIPFNILIDRNGRIAYRANDYENLKVEVEKLMK